ncbi:uncharacterized protein PODANS_0_1470 [Podospora anserina S mat+]|uniref:Podospora anserina S mat+ genomic DNA chromosome 4, supercontig 4 n=1 Tax=Podospora anserina (strain S / ATCC MYA-4624 / DSM 980 / FGSC 10383) TaxID=515849 RepID=B2AQU8_PODAN|nr:uncharacterized protein PODANS_0_1470 [Podospora anserina S mat+]CAP66526.1 unnamed protein product [Podospora anserina S mat+]
MVFKQSAKEENMSTLVTWRHPDLRFVPGVRAVVEEESEEESGEEGSESGSEEGEGKEEEEEEEEEEESEEGEGGDDDNELPGAMLDPLMGILTRTPQQAVVKYAKSFPFEKLPGFIQLDIFKKVLFKDGQLIHCVSRLDAFHPPSTFPPEEELERRSGLRHFFFWGPEKDCCVNTDGHEPAEVLALLQVSKRFLFLGTHVFYGLNTFAFSSLGEFHRFCQGSGVARVERIQHVEIVWTGNQHLTAPTYRRVAANGEEVGAPMVPFSRRTHALSWLVDMKRLKTLVVHINESQKELYAEGDGAPGYEEAVGNKTKGQPNYRMNRALRTVQGVDYIYQLRGMERVKWYDLNKAVRSGGGVRHEVEDWSFERDIETVVAMPKVPIRAEGSRLEKLRGLVGRGSFGDDEEVGDKGDGGGGGGGGGVGNGGGSDGGGGGAGASQGQWKPPEKDWELVRDTYSLGNGRCSYDELREGGSREYDADVASFALGSSRGGGRRRGGRMARGRRSGSVATHTTTTGYTSNLSTRISNLSSGLSQLHSSSSKLARPPSIAHSRASSPLFVGSSDDDSELVILDSRPISFNRTTEAADGERLRAMLDDLPPANPSAQGSMQTPHSTAPRRCTTTSSLFVSGYNTPLIQNPSTPTPQAPPRTPSMSALPPGIAQPPSGGLFVTPRPSAPTPPRLAPSTPSIKRESSTPVPIIHPSRSGEQIDLTHDDDASEIVDLTEQNDEDTDDEKNSVISSDSDDDSDNEEEDTPDANQLRTPPPSSRKKRGLDDAGGEDEGSPSKRARNE